MLGCESVKPKLFNWVTVALVTGWVLVVSILTEQTPAQVPAVSVEAFIAHLVN